MTTAMTRATIAIVRVSMARPYSVSPAVSPDPPSGTPPPLTDGWGRPERLLAGSRCGRAPSEPDRPSLTPARIGVASVRAGSTPRSCSSRKPGTLRSAAVRARPPVGSRAPRSAPRPLRRLSAVGEMLAAGVGRDAFGRRGRRGGRAGSRLDVAGRVGRSSSSHVSRSRSARVHHRQEDPMKRTSLAAMAAALGLLGLSLSSAAAAPSCDLPVFGPGADYHPRIDPAGFGPNVDQSAVPAQAGQNARLRRHQGPQEGARHVHHHGADEGDRRRHHARGRGPPLPQQGAGGAHERLLRPGPLRQCLVFRRGHGRARPQGQT